MKEDNEVTMLLVFVPI